MYDSLVGYKLLSNRGYYAGKYISGFTVMKSATSFSSINVSNHIFQVPRLQAKKKKNIAPPQPNLYRIELLSKRLDVMLQPHITYKQEQKLNAKGSA